MTADSNLNRPSTAEDNQDQGSENPAGPKGTQTWGSGNAPAGRGGAPAVPANAAPDEDQPSSGGGTTKGTGTHEGEAGAGRG